MKFCSKSKKGSCKEINPQPLYNFNKHIKHLDGLQSHCKSCQKTYVKAYSSTEKYLAKRRQLYRDNVDKNRKQKAAQYAKNPSKYLMRNKEWRDKNPETVRKMLISWVATNRGSKNAHCAKRRASKRSATPLWLNIEQLKEMEQIYKDAQELSWLSEGGLHVDHIIPLQNDLVCGLHVPWNLQIIPARGENGNCAKGNNFYCEENK